MAVDVDDSTLIRLMASWISSVAQSTWFTPRVSVVQIPIRHMNPCADCGHDRSDHDRGYMFGAWQYGYCWGSTPAGCVCLQYVPCQPVLLP